MAGEITRGTERNTRSTARQPTNQEFGELAVLVRKDLSEIEQRITRISQLSDHVGKDVVVRGWVNGVRKLGKATEFILLRDGFGEVQCVLKSDSVPKMVWDEANTLLPEHVVHILGTVNQDQRSKGGIEIKIKELHIDYQGPLFPVKAQDSTEFLLDNRHLSVRLPIVMDGLKIKAFIVNTARKFLDDKGFLQIEPPMISMSSCEGGATLFEVNYFGKPAYLSQSGQLYSEALISGHPLVYVYAPSFRAEPSRTPRHLTEFWQLEPEMAFYNQRMNMQLQGELIEHIAHEVAKGQPEILRRHGRDPQDLLEIKAPFEKMTYERAIGILKDRGVEIKWGDGVGLDEEKILVQERRQPVFLTNLPKEIRAFYMKVDPEDTRTVLDADLLAPEGIGEIIGGSERVADVKELQTRMETAGLNPTDYEWFLDLRRYGTVPHSGFGMGLERVTRWVLKLDSIRDAIPFPRNITRVRP